MYTCFTLIWMTNHAWTHLYWSMCEKCFRPETVMTQRECHVLCETKFDPSCVLQLFTLNKITKECWVILVGFYLLIFSHDCKVSQRRSLPIWAHSSYHQTHNLSWHKVIEESDWSINIGFFLHLALIYALLIHHELICGVWAEIGRSLEFDMKLNRFISTHLMIFLVICLICLFDEDNW